METWEHAALKIAAARWLVALGSRAAACEVRCPGSRYRVDVAGHGPGGTAVVECKRSRGDFLRETAERAELIRARAGVAERIRRFEEERIKPGEPGLRESGSFLFGDMERWALDRTRLSGYRRLLREARAIEARLYGQTKFCVLAHYRLAERMWVATPTGLLRLREVPVGWGLVEFPRAVLRAAREGGACEGIEGAARVRLAAPELGAAAARRGQLLANIAAGATRAWLAGSRAVAARDRGGEGVGCGGGGEGAVGAGRAGEGAAGRGGLGVDASAGMVDGQSAGVTRGEPGDRDGSEPCAEGACGGR